MKLSPLKESAAASEFEMFEFVAEGLAGATLDKLVEDALFCFLVTDN
jgi:hypothetical protein